MGMSNEASKSQKKTGSMPKAQRFAGVTGRKNFFKRTVGGSGHNVLSCVTNF
jgi:hypothetical protein